MSSRAIEIATDMAAIVGVSETAEIPNDVKDRIQLLIRKAKGMLTEEEFNNGASPADILDGLFAKYGV